MPPKPTPTTPQKRPAPLWQRAIDRFHSPFDARSTADYADTIADWSELPAGERHGHAMHLGFRIAGGLVDIAHNLREIRVLLARELPAIRRRLGELESLVDEHGTSLAAASRAPNVGDADEEEDGDEDEDEGEGDEGELENDDDLDREFERQQAARAPAPKPKPAEPPAEAIVPTEIIPAPKKPRAPRKKPVVVDGSAS